MYFVAMMRAGGQPHFGPGSSQAAGRAVAEQLVMWLSRTRSASCRTGMNINPETQTALQVPVAWTSPLWPRSRSTDRRVVVLGLSGDCPGDVDGKRVFTLTRVSGTLRT